MFALKQLKSTYRVSKDLLKYEVFIFFQRRSRSLLV